MHRVLFARTRSSRRGFTLIEMLVVVLILAILMAIALPLYLSAVANSERRVCRANMKSIANSVQAKRVARVLPNYGAIIAGGVTEANLPDLGRPPLCPQTGANNYTLENGSSGDSTTYRVRCPNSSGVGFEHGTFEPGQDSN